MSIIAYPIGSIAASTYLARGTAAAVTALYPPSADLVGTQVWFTDKPNAQGGAFVVRESSGTPGTYIYDRVGGGVIVADTLANILSGYVPDAAGFAKYSGCRFRVTNVGYSGSDWYSNGTELVPNAPVVITNTIDGYARAPTGTINTGSSGNITFGTAAPRAYTNGIYVYLPSIATTPAITAGYYWCVMSDTTHGTLYASKGGAAINFTVGAGYTGVTTDVAHPGTTIVGKSAINRHINAVGNVSATSNANTKTLQMFFDSSGGPGNGVSVISAMFNFNMYCRGSSTQIMDPAITNTSGATLRYSTVDITSDRVLKIQLNSGSVATDWVVIESFCVTLS